MSQTVITARITDQALCLVNRPLVLASGSEGVIQIKFEFCPLWEGYGKTAVFYRDANDPEVHHVPVVQGLATVPHEILADEGGFFFGVFGEADNTRTTEVVRLEVKQGAITVATAKPEDPTPDIYQQLIVTYSTIEAQINELVAMRNASGETEFSFSNEHITGSALTNGVCALMDLRLFGITLAARGNEGSVVSFDNFIDPVLNPFMTPEFQCFDETGKITEVIGVQLQSHFDVGDGKSRLSIYNQTDVEVNIDGWNCVQLYDLANPFNKEVSDLRIGYDGKTYPTAGEAVREQVRYAIKNSGKIKLFRFIGSPGGTCSLKDTTYADLKALYDDQKHIALYMHFSDIGDKYYHCTGAAKLNGVIGLAFQFCFGDKSEWVFVGEDDSVQMGTVSSSGVELDTTLTQSGKAADAKAVGDKLGDIETALDGIIAIQEDLMLGGGNA